MTAGFFDKEREIWRPSREGFSVGRMYFSKKRNALIGISEAKIVEISIEDGKYTPIVELAPSVERSGKWKFFHPHLSKSEEYFVFQGNKYDLVRGAIAGTFVSCEYEDHDSARAYSNDFSLVYSAVDNSNEGFIRNTENGSIVSKISSSREYAYAAGSTFTSDNELITCSMVSGVNYFRRYGYRRRLLGHDWKKLWENKLPSPAWSNSEMIMGSNDAYAYNINQSAVYKIDAVSGKLVSSIEMDFFIEPNYISFCESNGFCLCHGGSSKVGAGFENDIYVIVRCDFSVENVLWKIPLPRGFYVDEMPGNDFRFSQSGELFAFKAQYVDNRKEFDARAKPEYFFFLCRSSDGAIILYDRIRSSIDNFLFDANDSLVFVKNSAITRVAV